MIITKTPLRIPIAGGGTDLPGYYKKFGSFFISAAIDQYIYIVLKRRPIQGIRVSYSEVEEPKSIDEIKHNIIRSCLQYLKVNSEHGIEVVSVVDLPARSGMGSSGSFAVGLLNALHHMHRQAVPADILAQEACHVNMDMLKNPSGKQDEYIAAHGGITCFEISKSGKVTSYPLRISLQTISDLQNNLLLFYTGILRDANEVLVKQREAAEKNDQKMMSNLHKIQEIAYEIKGALEKGDTLKFGKLMDKHWQVKRKRAGTTVPELERWYEIAKKNGAIGGKIMGAGGGGFFAFYAEGKKEKLRKALSEEGLMEVRFRFDFEGSKLLINI
ncbi:MAG: galactokinase [Candidatus Parcubacteria bacterium]|nr:galactokinase [Candidatus Parcubacteria bacterium]